MKPVFAVVDDGTLDTVLQCENCEMELRFDSHSLLPPDCAEHTCALCDQLTPDQRQALFDDLRISTAQDLAKMDHECEGNGVLLVVIEL